MDYQSIIKNELESLENRLNQLVVSEVEFINLISGGLLSLGGKRIRPALCFLIAKMFQKSDNSITDWAAAIELLHTATLLHDDMIDNANKRRGKDAAFRVYGNAVSVLSGDFLLSRLVKILASLPVYFTDLIADTSKAVCEGEVLQFQMSHLGNFSIEQYFQVIKGKTAALMQAATQGTAMLCTTNNDFIEALSIFGLEYGLAFQIQDDLLDLIADESILGKPTGGDLHEGKATFPLIKLIELGGDIAQEVEIIIKRHGEEEDDLKRIVELAYKFNTITATQKEIESRTNKAIDALTILPDNPIKEVLIALAIAVTNRNH